MSEPDQTPAPDDAGVAPQATAAEVGAERRSREKHFEIVATLLLSLTALVTAWSGYQASLWDGIQSSSYTQATEARTEAALLRITANQLRLADLGIFESWVDAAIDGDEPLAVPEYRLATDAEADELEARASTLLSMAGAGLVVGLVISFSQPVATG